MRRRIRHWSPSWIILPVIAISGCGDGRNGGTGPVDEPVSGALSVVLTTPNTDDGAIIFEAVANGTTISGVTPLCSDCRLFFEQVSTTHVKGVVTGNLQGGPLVQLSVSDVKRPSSYTVRVVEVASQKFQLRSTTGYRLDVES